MEEITRIKFQVYFKETHLVLTVLKVYYQGENTYHTIFFPSQ